MYIYECFDVFDVVSVHITTVEENRKFALSAIKKTGNLPNTKPVCYKIALPEFVKY